MGFAFAALTLRFFICGFFGDTESCFSAFDKSRTFALGGGVTGRRGSNENWKSGSQREGAVGRQILREQSKLV